MRPLLLLILLATSGCLKSDIQAGSSTSSSLLGTIKSSSDADYKIFYYGTGSESFVGQLRISLNQLFIPSVYLSESYGNRQDPNLPVPLDLWLKVYEPQAQGDFYYESPILYKEIEVNTVSTALSWLIRFGFNNPNLKISRNNWKNLLLAIEIDCTSCVRRSSTEVLNYLLSRQEFIQQMIQRIQKENDVPLSWSWANPKPIIAHSNPTLNGTSTPDTSFAETQKVTLELTLLDIMNSTKRLFPQEWRHEKENNFVSLKNTEQWVYTFNYDDEGAHVVKAKFGDQVYNYIMTISNTNRLPIWQGEDPLLFRANKTSTYDLNDRAVDPDGALLNFGFVGAAPVGMTLDSINGVLRWAPLQAPDTPNHLGDSDLYLSAIDDQGGAKSGTVPLRVVADNLPELINPPTVWNLQEGTQGVLTLNTRDLDLDPVTANFSFNASILGGDPDGSGWNIVPIEISGALGNETLRVFYTPSYRQTVLQDQIVELTIAVRYDIARDFDLQFLNHPRTYTVQMNITNVDDPPQWTAQPQTLNLEELEAFTSKPAMGPDTSGVAMDVGPNPTAVTYGIDTTYESTNPLCIWGDYVDDSTPYLRIDPNTGEISGIPSLTSPRDCVLRFTATDATGLVTYSEPVTYYIADFNQDPIVRPDAIVNYNAVESTLLNINMLDIFDDADASSDPADPTERLQYDCLNCSDYGVNLSFSSNSMSWTPSYLERALRPPGGTYPFLIRVTDKAGVSVQTTVNIAVANAPVPPVINVNSVLTSTNEGSVASIVFTISAFSGDPIDSFNYSHTIDCQYNCRPGFYVTSTDANPTVTSANKQFTLQFTTNYSDGDSPAGYKDYSVTFVATAVGNPLVKSQRTVTLRVHNINRPPDMVGIGTGTPQYATTEYTIVISTTGDTKQPNGWIKKYVYNLGMQDLDFPDDLASYSWGTSNEGDVSKGTPPGVLKQLNGNDIWELSIPSCVSSGTPAQFVERVFVLRATDVGGLWVQRRVRVRINNATAIPSPFCM